MKVVSCKEMQDIDRKTIEVIGIPGVVLMENAGLQIVSAIEESFEDVAMMKVLVLAGKGNNGGDGFVVARHLHNAGAEVTTILLGKLKDIKGDAKINLDIIINMGLEVVEVTDIDGWEEVSYELYENDIVIDAIFGTGLKGAVKGYIAEIISDINECNAFVVAVDVPSGICGDEPQLRCEVVVADLTVTMAFPKYAHVLPPAEELCGELVVADISVPESLSSRLKTELVDDEFACSYLKERENTGHKGSYGHVLAIGGSVGKPGAVSLMGLGALTMGSGLVTASIPAEIAGIVNTHLMEIMTVPLKSTEGGAISAKSVEQVVELAKERSVVAIGPGMGTDNSTVEFVREFIKNTPCPVVIDADGLNAFKGHVDKLKNKKQTIIITPHPGEMAALTGMKIKEVQNRRIEIAKEVASNNNIIVVLKGYRTITATPDGKVFINSTGNPGMATAGSGDLLTGMIASMLGQGYKPEIAASLAVYFHGLAGDIAAENLGYEAVTSSELASYLGEALSFGEDLVIED